MVYLLYGLYFTQRCKPSCRIRITADAYRVFVEVAETAKKDEHLDVAYCAGRLMQSDAFDRVAYPLEFVPQRVGTLAAVRRRAEVCAASAQRTLVGSKRAEIVERLATVSEVYEAVKRPHLDEVATGRTSTKLRAPSFAERLQELNNSLSAVSSNVAND